MLARVTEKLVETKYIVILKHSSCKVIGWDLHPADRLRNSGTERFLHYLPRCIYLYFLKQRGLSISALVVVSGLSIPWSVRGYYMKAPVPEVGAKAFL